MRWGQSKARTYCHGGIRPDRKEPRDGCAALWPVWGSVGYYLETYVLIESGMPAPAHFTRSNWRWLHKIRTEHERIVREREPKEDP